MKSVTLSDIAKKTGYSVNTISHALRNMPDISEKTKAYIHETAQQMGYIPNTSAGTLRSGKSKSIAIIIGDISNPHFSIMIKEIERKLRSFGYTAFILNTDEDEKNEYAAIVSAISKNVDGIILCPVQKSRKNLLFLKENGTPFVLLGRHFLNDSSSFVVCDDENGGYAAANHLLSLGHHHLLFINGPSYISSAKERLTGIQRAASNISSAVLHCESVSFSRKDDQLLHILKKHMDCTGIICFSDMIAMQVCYFLKQLGKTVPQNVSVVGFDNIASKFYFPLMLTSVTSSKTKMSVQCVDALLDIISHPSAVHQYILPTKITLRESTSLNK